jgi:hypothetical protein
MPAPAVLRDVFNGIQDTWGQEDTGYLFENGPGPVSRLDVLVYRPAELPGATRFATVGMATAPQPDPGGRVELQFACRGRLDERTENAIAQQLANIAVYPWTTGASVNWGHVVPLGRDFPTFPGCSSVFLAGPLVQGGWDYIRTSDAGAVRIINVVPITEAERARARQQPPLVFVSELMAAVDIYSARQQWQSHR